MFQSIASCWPLLVEIKKEKTSSVISLTLSCLVLSCLLSCRTWSQCMPGRFFIPRARVNMALDTRQIFKSKSSSRFPNFDASNAWQMGHNSRQGYFLGQELLLDFAAWIDLTSNADNSLISPSCVRSYRTHFASLKRVDDLRVYQGFMMPFNHQAGYKVLKNNA